MARASDFGQNVRVPRVPADGRGLVAGAVLVEGEKVGPAWSSKERMKGFYPYNITVSLIISILIKFYLCIEANIG